MKLSIKNIALSLFNFASLPILLWLVFVGLKQVTFPGPALVALILRILAGLTILWDIKEHLDKAIKYAKHWNQ